MVHLPGQPTAKSSPSIALVLLSMAIVVLNVWAWAKSWDVSYLIAAVAFAALAPAFYFSPIGLRKSFKANAEATSVSERPGWVTGSTLTGVALLMMSLAVRWLS